MCTSEEASVYYRMNSGDWQTYTPPFIISEDGTHNAERYSVYADGDIEDIKTSEIKVGETAPELVVETYDGAEFIADFVNTTWTWTCSDACSGIDRLEYSYSLGGGGFSDCESVRSGSA